LPDNDSSPARFRPITAAEFARLSTSRQLALLVIRRAQLSSRIAVENSDRRKPRKDRNGA
jgi:hypothetical protein